MHPILAHRGRLLPYLAAWLPLAAVIAVLVRLAGGAPWLEAVALTVPLAAVFAFICLAAFYPCKATPLRRARLGNVILTHGLAGVVSTVVWLFLTATWSSLLEQLPPFTGAATRFPRVVLVLALTGLLLYVLAAALHYLLIAFEEARQSEKRELELRLLTREAELRALRAQVDPHFLFNTMNSIASLTTSDPAAARQMCLTLAEFLRDSLRVGSRAGIPLAEELTLAEKYLAIERVRFGARLRVEERVAEAATGCMVPPLLLQPLVENAVVRGIATLVDGGVVRIAVERTGERLAIVVENPFDPTAAAVHGEGRGLENVRARLAAAFGEGGRLTASRESGRFRVALDLPAALPPPAVAAS